MQSHIDIHNGILEILRANNAIDLTTLPTEKDKDSLTVQFQNLVNEKYKNAPREILARVEKEIFYSGPLDSLLHDPEVTEICVNGFDSIWFEKGGRMQPYSDHFYSLVSYNNFILRLTTECRIQANLDRPFADGYWRQFRVHLIIPPLAKGGAHLSLRRHPDNPWTLARLEAVGWASPDALSFLQKLIREHKSFLVVGSTGTGKTSLLNACLNEISQGERVVTIEDTSELRIPNRLSVKLISRTDPHGVLKDIDQMELIKQALRMRPDRIIMGEIRGAEAKDLLMALSTGHQGGMATMHAESARQALYRLEMLVQLGAPQWSITAIRHLIFFGIQYVISIRRHDGSRRLDGIHKIVSLEDSGYCLEKVI